MEMQPSSEEKERKVDDTETVEKDTNITLDKTQFEKLMRFKKMTIVVGVLVILGLILFSIKGLFVAAMVDGSPISRLSVINSLEKQSGSLVLDALIVEKLITKEAGKKGIEVSSEDIDAEIALVEEQIVGTGEALEVVLEREGLTLEDLIERIEIQKMLEELVSETVDVTSEEVTAFLAQNGAVEVVEGDEAWQQAYDQIENSKLNASAQTFVEDLRNNASITYFLDY